MDPTNEELRRRVHSVMPEAREALERLVRIPSVAFGGHPAEHLQGAAAAVAELLRRGGLADVRLVQVPDGPKAVFGFRPPEAGAPTVLLYGHYDVQPAGDPAAWTSPPFEPEVRAGRLYGRGAADNKGGVVMHFAALRALGADCRVGLKVLIEGAEEAGLGGLEELVEARPELVQADVVVVGDVGNYSLGVPTLTTSLRGLAAVDVTVRSLRGPVHSGMFGGAAPDALLALVRMIAGLHDDAGDVRVEGLKRLVYDGAEYDEADYRRDAGLLPGVELMGTGTVGQRLYARPSLNVIGIDAPPVEGAGNVLLPEARARVSLRLAPGESPQEAQVSLTRHLRASAPWGVLVEVAPVAAGEGFSARTDGPAYKAAQAALKEAYGREPVRYGQGGSIPLVAAFQKALPQAEIIMWGPEEPACRIHGADESVDLAELERCILAESLFLCRMRGIRR